MDVIFFDFYKVRLTLLRKVLATNSCDPNIVDKFQIERQRKLILERGQLNSQINKYLDAIQISKERGDKEVEKIFDKLEVLTGISLTSEEKKLAVAGNLESLKETFKELKLSSTTVFYWDKEKDLPCIGSHMISGFLKAASEAISKSLPKKDGKVLYSDRYTSSIINQHVSVVEEFITFSEDVIRDKEGNSEFLQRSLRAETVKGPRIAIAKSEQVEKGAKLEFLLRVMGNSPMTEWHLNQLFKYGEMKGLGQWRNADYGQFSYILEKVEK